MLSLFFNSLFVVLLKESLSGKGPRRFHFDQGAKQLVEQTYRWRGEVKTEGVHALSDILAIQLLYSGYHHHSHYSEQGVTTDERFYTYEMNLVLDRADAPRLHLVTHGDWQWMREAGQKLADFLGVPIVDQLQHGS